MNFATVISLHRKYDGIASTIYMLRKIITVSQLRINYLNIRNMCIIKAINLSVRLIIPESVPVNIPNIIYLKFD